ncbi:MAG: hypothetical protein WCY32_13770 [Burkholderiaceae bacterium]
MIGRYCSMTLIAAALAAPTLAMAADPVSDQARDATPPAPAVQRTSPPATPAAPSAVPATPSAAPGAPTAAPATPSAVPVAPPAARDATRFSDRDGLKAWSGNKKELEQALGTGHDRAHYRQALEKMGYAITAINKDEPDYLEYEVIDGDKSYEIQVDFDKGTGKSTKVDVTRNLWKADTTRQALAASDYKYTYPTAPSADAERSSDRARLLALAPAADKLETELGTGQDRAHYRQALEDKGYTVTSVNYDKPDYLEYEVVKGEDSYEVQIDFDEATGKSKKVDVTVNAIRSDATERALPGAPR